MKRGKLAYRILSYCMLVVLCGESLYGIICFSWLSKQMRKNVEKDRVIAKDTISTLVDTMGKSMIVSLNVIAHNPAVQEALYLRQKDRLEHLTKDIWTDLHKHGISQFQFYLPSGDLFLHLQDTSNGRVFGIKKMIDQSRTEHRPVAGLGLDQVGWGYHIITPVSYMGQDAGLVEMVIDVRKVILGKVKEKLGGEWRIASLLGKGDGGELELLSVPKVVASTSSQERHCTPWYFEGENKTRIVNGEALFCSCKDGTIEIAVPLKDYTGRVGLIVIQKKPNLVKKSLNNLLVVLWILSILDFLGIALVSFLAINSSVAPIIKITEMINDISTGEGDLTKKIDFDSNDEVGALARGFNQFVDKQHKMISQIRDKVEVLLSKMGDLVSQMVSVDQTSKEQSDQVNRIATAVEEMNSTVSEIAGNAETAARVSDEASDKAGAGASVVRETIDGMNRIADVVDKAAEKIHSLGEKSAQIGEIIGVIDDIADQTNLLALNAAIEAARAGEHGRGFAVVADEVRKLAERTSQATKEVAATIKTIQEETHEAVESMEESKKEVEQGKELASASGSALEEIKQSVESVTGMINQIANATREQSQATEEITQSIEGITLLSKKLSDISSGSRMVVEELAGLVNEIKGQVDRFKL